MMAAYFFLTMSMVSAVFGTYCAVKATMDKGAHDLANAAMLLCVILALSYAVSYAVQPHLLAQFTQETLK